MNSKFPSPPPRSAWTAGLLLLAPLLLSCGPRFDQGTLTISRAGGEPVQMTVEVARTNTERAQGLMHRKSLDEGRGMLFVFDRDQILSFWMKNTSIPLSIAFIARDGRILEIRDMRPLDESSVRSGRSARYALEAPRGWFSRAGIAPGDQVFLDDLVQ
jgi:uncharacterized membrane protein (UPF0127 family)